jgi:hypothetical protein
MVACVLLILAGTGPLWAQQPNAPTAAMAIGLPDVVAEVKAAYDRYNDAINSGNIAILNSTFRNDPRTIRYGQVENLYGYKEIEGFSAGPLDHLGEAAGSERRAALAGEDERRPFSRLVRLRRTCIILACPAISCWP